MNRRQGTTLIELMAAAGLSGMILLIALPVILTGKRISRRLEEEEMFSMAGDGIFFHMREEMMFSEEGVTGTGESYGEPFLYGAGTVIEVDEREPDCVMLTVKIVREEEILYERNEEVHLLNWDGEETQNEGNRQD